MRLPRRCAPRNDVEADIPHNDVDGCAPCYDVDNSVLAMTLMTAPSELRLYVILRRVSVVRIYRRTGTSIFSMSLTYCLNVLSVAIRSFTVVHA